MQGWVVEQTQYDKECHAFYESLFALSNGYVGLRSTVEFEADTGSPGVFFANVYDFGVSVPNNIVNAPNWLDISLTIGTDSINLDKVQILDFRRVLHMYQAYVETMVRFKDRRGRITRYVRRDRIHGKRLNLAMVEGEICPENYEETIIVESAFNFRQGNSYHGGYFGNYLKSHHLQVEHHSYAEGCTELAVRTRRSSITLALIGRTASEEAIDSAPMIQRQRYGSRTCFRAAAGVACGFRNLYTFSHSVEDEDALSMARQVFTEAQEAGWRELVREHEAEWQTKWERAYVDIHGDARAQEGIRYSVFQMLQAPYLKRPGTNIAARGLTSEYHHGHFFFNTEFYKVPFWAWVAPEVAKSLIMYRTASNEAAAEHARETGFQGLRWSEESGPDGRPAGPTTVTDYLTGVTTEEWTGRLVHFIGAGVAWAIWSYESISGDREFVLGQAFETLVGIGRFYASLVARDPVTGKYGVLQAMGSDEYHYPVANNFLTNGLAKWTLSYVVDTVRRYRESGRGQGVSDAELAEWMAIYEQMRPPRVNETGVIEQFDGYFDLPDQQVEEYGLNGRPIMPADVAQLSAAFRGPQTKLIKQCDVVMLMSLLRGEFPVDVRRANFDYYDPRTLHESSLSPTQAGIVAADIGNVEGAYRFFMMSSRFNLDFQPRNGYNNGLHLGAFAGAWLILHEGMLGANHTGARLSLHPRVPQHWTEVTVRFSWRGRRFQVKVDQEGSNIQLLDEITEPVEIDVYGQTVRVQPGSQLRITATKE